jgi:hypothetical protein
MTGTKEVIGSIPIRSTTFQTTERIARKTSQLLKYTSGGLRYLWIGAVGRSL